MLAGARALLRTVEDVQLGEPLCVHAAVWVLAQLQARAWSSARR